MPRPHSREWPPIHGCPHRCAVWYASSSGPGPSCCWPIPPPPPLDWPATSPRHCVGWRASRGRGRQPSSFRPALGCNASAISRGCWPCASMPTPPYAAWPGAVAVCCSPAASTEKGELCRLPIGAHNCAGTGTCRAASPADPGSIPPPQSGASGGVIAP